MKTRIKTVHEEEYSDKSRTLGVLLNYSDVDQWKDSLVYIYRDGMYIFFNTMVDMIDYLLYGESKMKRAYMPEEEFDNYYDTDFIEGKFTELLKWT
jgi:hypothetical protein